MGEKIKTRIRALLIGTICLFLFAAAGWWGFWKLAPAPEMPESLRHSCPASVEFLDRRGHPLRALLVQRTSYVFPVHLGELPPHFIEAVLAAEDRKFFSHKGLDFLATLRAAASWIRHGEPKSGASTITQQLSKILLRSEGEIRPRSISQKIREIRLALRIEKELTKTQILEEYLSRLEYGNMQRGIAAASRFYFGKSPADLSLAESCFLAALPNAPTRLDPYRSLDSARERQLHILHRMLEVGWIDSNSYARARYEKLLLIPPAKQPVCAAPHFIDLLLHRRGVLPSEGGAVSTTLDAALNRLAYSVLSEQLQGLAANGVGNAAAVILHNPTGEVLAMASASREDTEDHAEVISAWTPRSAGSALKPFAFALAIEQGCYPGTVVADVPTSFPTATGLYRPNNYQGRFHGPVSFRQALGNSLNIAAIRVLQLAGGPEKFHRLLLELGFSSLTHPPEHYGLGLVIGNAETRLLELANAYATLARQGVYRPIQLLRAGPSASESGRRVFSEETAWLVTNMLADPLARAASFGLDSPLRLPFPAACKTGTSSNYRDNVAVGFTPEFTVAVWAGNLDGAPMQGITGVTGAAPVLRKLLVHLQETRGTTDFRKPTTIQQVWIDPLTGNRLSAEHPRARREFCAVLPPAASAADYDESGRVRLPNEYARWLTGPQNLLGQIVSSETAPGTLRIESPRNGSVFTIDPDIPNSRQRAALRAEGSLKPDSLRWSCETLPPIGSDGMIQLLPGRHRLLVQDPASFSSAESWIEVLEM